MKHRPRPWWFHLIRNAVPIVWLLVFAGLLWALMRLAWSLLGGKL